MIDIVNVLNRIDEKKRAIDAAGPFPVALVNNLKKIHAVEYILGNYLQAIKEFDLS